MYRYSRSFTQLILVGLAAPLVFTGCSGPAQAVHDAAPTMEDDFFNRELLLNNSFEDWDRRLPLPWRDYPAKSISLSDDAYEGDKAVTMTEGAKKSSFHQTVPADHRAFGARVRATVHGKTSVPKGIILSIEFDIDGKTGRINQQHSGKNRWEKLLIDRRLPERFDPDSLKVRVTFRGKPGEAVADMASVYFVPE